MTLLTMLATELRRTPGPLLGEDPKLTLSVMALGALFLPLFAAAGVLRLVGAPCLIRGVPR
jgi:hypothetical protein